MERRSQPTRNRTPTPAPAPGSILVRTLGTGVVGLLLGLWTSTGVAGVPTAESMLDAYAGIERRIQGEAGDEQPLPDVGQAASVTFRLRGEILGRSGVVRRDGNALAEAFEAAWSDALELLAEREEETGLQLRDLVTIEVEAGDALTPLMGATFASAVARLSPGLDGVAMRASGKWTAVFPGEMCKFGLSPDRAARLCAARLELPPLEWEELRSTTGAALYAFRTQRLVQLAPSTAPTFLFRCSPLLPAEAITLESLRGFAASCADHIARREWLGPEPFGLRADFSSTTGYTEGPFAPPRPQAMAAYALSRYASLSSHDDEERSRLLGLGTRILTDLLEVHPAEEDPFTDLPSLSAWVLAASALHASGAAEESFGTLADAARDGVGRLRVAYADETEWRRVSPGERAFVAYAIAVAARWHDDQEALRAEAEGLVRSILRTTPTEQLAAVSPWLGLGVIELTGDGPIGASIALREFRELAWRFQVGVGEVDSAGEMDLVGGVAFTRGGAPRPDWQTLRVGYLGAAMLGDARLTNEDELAQELARMLQISRFAMQLSITGRESGLTKDPRRSVGGVRRAAWDPVVSLDATALSLLTVTELIEGVERRSRAKIQDSRE